MTVMWKINKTHMDAAGMCLLSDFINRQKETDLE